jgi:valine dehydrogenase (NAD+)
VADTIEAAIICGAANNQLVDDEVDNRLAERGVIYCPDYLVNAGGVIQVADELHGFDFERAQAKTATIFDTLLDVLATAKDRSITPAEAADRLAERRMAAAGERIWAPPTATAATPA